MLSFADLRQREFSRLDKSRHVYADYTGSALYGTSQLLDHYALLARGVFGNPHAEARASRASTELMDRVRDTVLQFFGVDASTHDVCFTANATAAIKLVAESYPFSDERGCVLSVDNHNSVNGIREFARRAGAAVQTVRLDRNELPPDGPALFAFPAQSNFSGVQYPLSLVDIAHERGLDVLVDAAAYVPGQSLNLRDCEADFTALSFYKMFGYPTGVGALIARRDALAKLQRPWFAGGTVLYASVAADTHRLRPGHDAFEDGTPDFLGISALPSGFALLNEIGMDRIQAHVERLTSLFVRAIKPFATLYGRTAFNIEGIPYWTVEEQAWKSNISLRGGCFCNPGASEIAFGLEEGTISRCFARLGSEFSVERFAECTSRSVGAVRVSFGVANNDEDVHRVVYMLERLAATRAPQLARSYSLQ
ncbi:MAG TPA: aminotransferase class V-fold PLP-dependent enzyme [Thermoanaerobaculia bacterium]|nr:aminotransferase class V-fold PLP-dependent enzyme [Thermoanaerobaculia bacterium]